MHFQRTPLEATFTINFIPLTPEGHDYELLIANRIPVGIKHRKMKKMTTPLQTAVVVAVFVSLCLASNKPSYVQERNLNLGR